MWDYRLLKAQYMIDEWYRDGIPIWWDESERVTFNAKGRISKSRAAIERAQEASTKGNKKAVPGRYFIAEPQVIGGGELPTREEWMEEQSIKSGTNGSVSKFATGNERMQVSQGR
jgi:hypothetical protein